MRRAPCGTFRPFRVFNRFCANAAGRLREAINAILTLDYRSGPTESSPAATTRASGAYVRDWLGRYVPVPTNAPVVDGLNPVRNLHGTSPWEDFYAVSGEVTVTKISERVWQISVPGTGAAARCRIGATSGGTNEIWGARFTLRRISGPSTAVLMQINGGVINNTVTLPGDDSTIELAGAAQAASATVGWRFLNLICTSAQPLVYEITLPFIQNLTGRPDPDGQYRPGPYVSVGVGTGPNLLTGDNSTFDNGVGDWTNGPNTGIAALNGKLNIANLAPAVGYAILTISVVPGKTYEIGLDYTDRSTNQVLRLSVNNGASFAFTGTALAVNIAAPQIGFKRTFVPTGSTVTLGVINNTVNNNTSVAVDNLSVRQCDPGHTGVDGFAYFDTDNQGNALSANGAWEVQPSAVTNLADTQHDFALPDTISLTAGTYTLRPSGDAAVTVAAGTATITGGGQATADESITFEVTADGTVTLTLDSGTLQQTADGHHVLTLTAGTATNLPAIVGTRAADVPAAIPFYLPGMEPVTNLLSPSQDISDGIAPNGVVVERNVALDSSGAMTADKITPHAGFGTKQTFRTFPGEVNTTYCFSVELRYAGHRYCAIELANTAFASRSRVVVDLINGTIEPSATEPEPQAYGIEEVDSGLFLAWVVNTSDADGGNYVANILLVASPTEQVYEPADLTTGVYVSNRQVEVGTTPSRRIITTTGPATGPKTPGLPYTVVIEFDGPLALPNTSSGTLRLLSAQDPAGDDLLYIDAGSSVIKSNDGTNVLSLDLAGQTIDALAVSFSGTTMTIRARTETEWLAGVTGPYDGAYPSDGVLHLVKTAGSGASLYRIKRVPVFDSALSVGQLTSEFPPGGV